MLPGLAPSVAGDAPTPLSILLAALGLAPDLLLDFGDAACYPGTSQAILNLGTGAETWYPGSSSGSDSTDATFNGTAGGLSLAEFFSFDGGDYLGSSSAPAYVNGWHKNNALFSIYVVASFGSVANINEVLLGNNTSGSQGFTFGITTTGVLQLVAKVNAGGNSYSKTTSTLAAVVDAVPHVFSVSMDEAAASAIFGLDGAYETISGSYSSPSSTNASNKLRAGARGDGSSPIPAGSRIWAVIGFNGVAHSSTVMDEIYSSIRSRFP